MRKNKQKINKALFRNIKKSQSCLIKDLPIHNALKELRI